MRSRVHPKYKTKYRVSNWSEYDRALVQRGDITLWMSKDAIDSWKPSPTGRRGAQRKFSDHAIEAALTLRLVFKLPLRQAEGFLRSVFENPQARFAIAFALHKLGRLEDSAEAYRAAIAMHPDFADAYLNLARVEFERGRSDDAIDALQALLARDPAHAEARRLLAELPAKRE